MPCALLLCVSAGVVPDGKRHDLLEEVANLVESPTVVLGSLHPAFLTLPRCWAHCSATPRLYLVSSTFCCAHTGKQSASCGRHILEDGIGCCMLHDTSLSSPYACLAAGRCL